MAQAGRQRAPGTNWWKRCSTTYEVDHSTAAADTDVSSVRSASRDCSRLETAILILRACELRGGRTARFVQRGARSQRARSGASNCRHRRYCPHRRSAAWSGGFAAGSTRASRVPSCVSAG